jgi:hypothetical protein
MAQTAGYAVTLNAVIMNISIADYNGTVNCVSGAFASILYQSNVTLTNSSIVINGTANIKKSNMSISGIAQLVTSAYVIVTQNVINTSTTKNSINSSGMFIDVSYSMLIIASMKMSI